MQKEIMDRNEDLLNKISTEADQSLDDLMQKYTDQNALLERELSKIEQETTESYEKQKTKPKRCNQDRWSWNNRNAFSFRNRFSHGF